MARHRAPDISIKKRYLESQIWRQRQWRRGAWRHEARGERWAWLAGGGRGGVTVL
jgi:hypothetical protein